MDPTNTALNFLDLLDIDEELIDIRFNSLIEKTNYTEEHLKNALLLLQYKHLINKREGTECENDIECNLIVKLLSNLEDEHINIVCQLVKVVLCLNVSTIISKSEHLVQQILSSMHLPNTSELEKKTTSVILSNLKICDSILDAVIEHGQQITLYFMEVPLTNIFNYSDETLKVHFLTQTVPKFYVGVRGYNVLDKIWDYMKLLQQNQNERALKILCCLSQYYLPIEDSQGNIKTHSEIIHETKFWRIILYGLNSQDASIRKTAIYLAKRAIDYVGWSKSDVHVKYETETIFNWMQNYAHIRKVEWDNFFILIETLEEKQSNIVLPSLQLFVSLQFFTKCWLMCAFKLGLRHDNASVRLKCVDYAVNYCATISELVLLLETFNDIYLFENINDTKLLQSKIERAITVPEYINYILKVIPLIKWSPVPLYILSKVLSTLNVNNLNLVGDENFCIDDHNSYHFLIMEILKMPCNNIIIRKAIHLNISHFIANCGYKLDWKSYAHIYPLFQNEFHDGNPFIKVIKNITLTHNEKFSFFNYMAETHLNVEFCLLYLVSHPEYVPLFIHIVYEVLEKIKNIVDRQYSNKLESIKDVLYITYLFGKTNKKQNEVDTTINEVIYRDFKIIFQYILCLFTNESLGIISDLESLFITENFVLHNLTDEITDILLELYKTSTIFLIGKNADIDKRVLSMFIINNIIINNEYESFVYKHSKLDLEMVINFSNDFQKVQSAVESVGRIKSRFHEECCKLIYTLLKEQQNIGQQDLLNFVERVLDCGGYGCLKWILKIVNKILPIILSTKEFNLTQFLSRTWNEIEELKSNNKYYTCIKDFVDIITNDVVMDKPEYNNIILSYCSQILEYATMKNSPLCCLVMKLNEKSSLPPHLICFLCEVLLYSPIQRKDQRIMDHIEIQIVNDAKYGFNNQRITTHYDFHIQYLSVATLSKIKDLETLRIISNFIKTKIDIMFRNKTRYHGNSLPHRTLLMALQHFLFILLLNEESRMETLFSWCVEILGRLPHQPSVRVCLEWYITLYLYLEKRDINELLLDIFKSKNVPLSSQFSIIYWLSKHKMLRNLNISEEFDFVMDTLLSHTMGQIFNIRLQAQYLSNNLSKLNKNGSSKYESIIGIIEKTFAQSNKDKNYCKLKDDYFANHFDIVSNLTPYFIYEMVTKYSEVNYNNEKDVVYVKNVIKDINKDLNEAINEFKDEWIKLRLDDDSFDVKIIEDAERNNEVVEPSGTIQKKYIPWRNMSDVNPYEVGKKRDSGSQLIVVASLIDKLPNLGGMARTCEVFGVNRYIVDSLRHLADKQFQGLSVSAEKWVDVQEVRPGNPLKEYLIAMKSEGYSIVAAEQTSTSCQLQGFRFPKKTLLLLGHEKEGVPCDVLPMMDHCVEIPQQGFVRSLNVHVTAAIFVWEYARQNIL